MRSATPCQDLCLSIKLAKTPAGRALLTERRVDQMVARVNRIWGCRRAGQCCIRVNKMEYVVPGGPDAVPREVSLRASRNVAVRRIARRDACYNVYIVSRFTGYEDGDPQAYTYYDPAATIMMAERPTAAALGTLLAHALGLARGPADDPDGVTGHSTRRRNLMNIQADRIELNERQCTRARGSPLLTDSEEPCTLSPQEP